VATRFEGLKINKFNLTLEKGDFSLAAY